MRERSDPLIPILGSAVALVVIGAIGLVFYPRISRWFGPGQSSVTGQAESPNTRVPVWVCRSVEGVALIVEGGYTGAAAKILNGALEGGPYHYVRLSVYNFGQDETFSLELDRFVSPSGGAAAVPAIRHLRADLEEHRQTVLRGLGAVAKLEVAKGRRGQALLVIKDDPGKRSSFVSGNLIFERREVERLRLATWRARPTLKQFMDF